MVVWLEGDSGARAGTGVLCSRHRGFAWITCLIGAICGARFVRHRGLFLLK